VGLLVALLLALMAAIAALLAPLDWGSKMWPYYLGTAGVLAWAAIDLWTRLREPPDASVIAPLEALDTDMLLRDATVMATRPLSAEEWHVRQVDLDISKPFERSNWRHYDERAPVMKPLRDLQTR